VSWGGCFLGGWDPWVWKKTSRPRRKGSVFLSF